MEGRVIVRKIKNNPTLALLIIIIMCITLIMGCVGDRGPQPADILPRLEAAYNNQDIYAMARCFEPSVVDAAFGLLDLFGLGGSLMEAVLPLFSSILGATGALDEGQWGTVRLSEVSTQMEGNSRARLTYEVHLTFADGRTSTFTETIQTVLVDGVWYIAAIQMPMQSGTERQSVTEAPPQTPVLNENEPNTNVGSQAQEIERFLLDVLYPFSEDRAWVQFSSNGVSVAAVINIYGEILFERELRSSRNPITAPFTDGLSYIIFRESDDMYFYIINNDGMILYDSSADDNNFILLGYGDGHFVVAQHISNFATNEWRLGTIDANGNILNELKEHPNLRDSMRRPMVETLTSRRGIYSNNYTYHSEYLGGGWWSLSGRGNISRVWYDANTNNLYNNRGLVDLIGINIAQISGTYNGKILVGRDVLLTPDLSAGIYHRLDFGASSPVSGGCVRRWGGIGPITHNANYIGEGLVFNREAGAYFNLYGEKAFTMPAVLDGMEFVGGPFQGGYAALRIIGADRNIYVTVIDKTGTMQYEPVMVEDFFFLNAGYGYVIVATVGGVTELLGRNGNVVNIGHDNLDNLGNATFANLSGGFFLRSSSNTYLALDGRVIEYAIRVR